MKIHKLIVPLILTFAINYPSLSFAQLSSEELLENREAERERRIEDLENLKQIQAAPKTAADVLELLKERAKTKIEEKRKELLRKKKFSVGVTAGYESNPLNDGNNKGDSYNENSFTFDWTPTFSPTLSGDFGYSLYNRMYFDQNIINSNTHTLSGFLKIIPFKSGKFSIEPGVKKEWSLYPFDESSVFDQWKTYLKYTYTIDQKWSHGGKYDYAYKTYATKNARNLSAADIDGLDKKDYRNTAEWWLKRQIGKYSLKLKGKSYRNNSNDEYQKYDDYDSHDGELSLSAAFLKDYKLYVIFSSDFEAKHYRKRASDDNVARSDRILQYRLNNYYTINKTLSLNYSFSLKNSNSNKSTGEFSNITNSLGLTINF